MSHEFTYAKYTFRIHNGITPKGWKTKRITSHGIANTENNQYNVKTKPTERFQ